AAPVRCFLAAVRSRFRGEPHDIARLEVEDILVALRLHPEHREAGMAALIVRHVEPRGLRVEQLGYRRAVSIGRGPVPCPVWWRQQFLAVQNLKHTVVPYTPGEINTIADRVIGRAAAGAPR